MQFSLDWVTKAVTLPWYTVEEKKCPWVTESSDGRTDFIPLSDSFVTFLPLCLLDVCHSPSLKARRAGAEKLWMSSLFTAKKAELRDPRRQDFPKWVTARSPQVLPSWNNEVKVILKSKVWAVLKDGSEIDYGKIEDKIGALLLLLFLRWFLSLFLCTNQHSIFSSWRYDSLGASVAALLGWCLGSAMVCGYVW